MVRVDKEVKKTAFLKFYDAFAKWHRPFLRELAQRYKEYGRYPLIPFRELATCYQRNCDMEVAALAGLLIRNNANIERNIREFRLMFGDSPYEWFRSRQFAVLPSGKEHGTTTGGVDNWTIAEYFDQIYNNDKTGNLQFIPMLSIILANAIGKDNYYYHLHLLRLVLATYDGMGIGLWRIDNQKLKCPENRDTRAFLKLWLPMSCRRDSLFTFDEGVKLMGMNRDSDFFYAYLGWQELCKRKPMECSRYSTVYNKRYTERNLLEEKYWINGRDAIIPHISFV